MLKLVIYLKRVRIYHKLMVDKVARGLTYNLEVIGSKLHIIVFKILFLGCLCSRRCGIEGQWVLNEVTYVAWAQGEVMVTRQSAQMG